MKHIYFFFAMLLAAVFAMPAGAQESVSFTIDFDDPAAVTVLKDYSTPVAVTKGENTFTLEMYSSLQVSAADGYAFSSITTDAGTPQSYYDNTWYISYYGSASDWDGKKFIVKTINLEASRTGSFTMTVDDPTKVTAMYAGTSANLNLLEGTNTYKFNPEVETSLYLMSTSERNLYSVKVDGVAVSTSDYTIEVPLTEGCNIEVEANYPDIPVTVTFEYDAENCPGLVQSYSINYAYKGDVTDNKIEAQAGDNIQVQLNSSYKVDNVFLNGAPYDLSYFYGTISLSPAENTVVKIEAHPYGKINGVINIELPEAITLYDGYQNEENIITLQKGRNEIGVSEKDAVVAWKVDPAYKIVSVTDGQGNAITNSSVNVEEGFELNFIIEELVLDKSFVFWVDDKSAAMYYFRLSNSERNSATIDNGYNIVNFTDSFNPYEITWAGGPSGVGSLYVNGEQKTPYYEGGTYWTYNFNDGDVAKAFVKSNPEPCTVNFEANGNPQVSVVRNIITEVADWEAGFTDFPGTQVNIAPAEGKLVKVEVDGAELKANEAGAFQFIVEGNTTVTVTELLGIAGIEADAETDAAVYNLQGVKVGTKSTMGNLPAGLYITAGKKVTVK